MRTTTMLSKNPIASLARSWWLVLTFWLCAALPGMAATTPASWFAGGTGTEANPYRISDLAELLFFANYINQTERTGQHFQLTNHINCGKELVIIGTNIHDFESSTFDGGGYTISNGWGGGDHNQNERGFFGRIVNSTIKNLRLVNYTAYGNNDMGFIVGTAYGNSTIENCHVESSTIEYYGQRAGGIVGYVPRGTLNIRGCAVNSTNTIQTMTTGESKDTGGLIGAIANDATVNVYDCLVHTYLNNRGGDAFVFGGIAGSVGGTLNLIRVVSAARFYHFEPIAERPNNAQKLHGTVVGWASRNGAVNCYATYVNKSQNPADKIDAYAYDLRWINGYNNIAINTSWTFKNIYDLLERKNDYGNTRSPNEQGSRAWKYVGSAYPEPSATNYIVKMTKSGNISGHLTGCYDVIGTDYYTGAGNPIKAYANAPSGMAAASFTYSGTKADGGTISGNEWTFKPTGDGHVDAKIVSVPKPKELNATFDQWNNKVKLSFKADNPDNLTGTYHFWSWIEDVDTDWVLLDPIREVRYGYGAQLSCDIDLAPEHLERTQMNYLVSYVNGNPPKDEVPYPAIDTYAPTYLSTVRNINITDLKATPLDAPNDRTIRLTFTAPVELTGDASVFSYKIQSSIDGGKIWIDETSDAQAFNGTGSYSFDHTGIGNPCTGFIYRVKTEAFGKTFDSNTTKETHSKGTSSLTKVEATKGEYASQVRISWETNKLDNATSLRYRIFRSVANVKNAPEQLLITLNTIEPSYFYDDNQAQPGIFYNYRVVLYQTCENEEKEASSMSEIGFSQSFGTVSGRVTYGTGAEVANVSVRVKRNDLQGNESQNYSLRANANPAQTAVWRTDSVNFKNIFNNNFSFQFFVRPDNDTTATPELMHIPDVFRLYLVKTEDDRYRFKLDDLQGSTETVDIPAVTIAPERFSHISLVKTNTAGGLSTLTLYVVNDENIDSVYIQSAVVSAGLKGLDAYSNPGIVLGRIFNGNIDETRLWSKVLTEAEILRDYNRMIAGNESNLKAYWTFDEGLYGYFFDSSRSGTVFNRNHGTHNIEPSTDSSIDLQTLIPAEEQLSLKGITDKDGNYQIRGIPFSGEGTSYDVVPSLGVHVFNPVQHLRYIGNTSLVHNSVDFTDISSFDVKGTVMYEGGTYPVADCSFEVDGVTQTRNGEPIYSDIAGEFTISVPIGIHSVRVVKMGHTFANGGYLKGNDGKDYNYNAPRLNTNFYDQTKVKLIGRVAGGLKENDKDLGFGESVNNLGASEITLTAAKSEQYDLYSGTPAEPTVSETFRHNEGQWRRPGVDGLQEDYTTVTYGAKSVKIKISDVTGEFVAWVYPEVYTIGNIVAPGYGQSGMGEPIYTLGEGLDLSKKTVPDDNYMQLSIRTFTDSVYIANDTLGLRPGELPYWRYSEQSDTVRYHEKWQTYYQAVPTFSVTQIVKKEPVKYFGGTEYIIDNSYTGEQDTVPLVANPSDDYPPVYTFGLPVYEQKKEYTYRFKAYEEYTNQANGTSVIYRADIEKGSVNVTGNTFALGEQNASLEMDTSGEALYTFTAGAPDLTTATHQFFATLQIGAQSYNWNLGSNPVAGYHLGSKSTGTNFMTAGPDEVIAILRDPPGSNSYSYLEKGTTITTSHKSSITNGLSSDRELKLKLGGKVTLVTGLGVATEVSTAANLDIVAGLTAEQKWVKEFESVTTATLTERYETSSDPEYVGSQGDVFIGYSTNIQYGLVNSINIQKNFEPSKPGDTAFETYETSPGDPEADTYSIAPAYGLAYGDNFDTKFVYTLNQLENITIPMWKNNLRNIIKLPGEPVDPNYIQNPVIVSNLPATDPRFGKKNSDRAAFGVYASDTAFKGPSYTIHFPASWLADDNSPDALKFNAFQDSVIWYNNQIDIWTQELARNEEQKVKMKRFPGASNYSFGGGSSTEWSTTLNTSDSRTSSFTWTLNPKVGLETGFDINDNLGMEITASISYNHEDEQSNTDAYETSRINGFVLAEQGTTDQLSVDYGDAAGTIAFKLRGGQTSCPFEDVELTQYYQPGQHILSEGSMQVEVPKIDVKTGTPDKVINVPANRPAEFMLELKNESETNEDLLFYLYVDEATNPYGAGLSIDGIGIGNGRYFLVKAGQELNKTLKLSKGSVDSYDKIGIILSSTCDAISDTTWVSAEFIPACSEISMSAPVNNWLANRLTGDTLSVVINGFDVNFANFGYVQLEYRSTSSAVWSTLQSFYADSALYKKASTSNKTLLKPTDQYISYPWGMNNVTDGAYELRATAVCVDSMGLIISSNTTPAVSGYIDMVVPVALGAPSPVTGIYGAGDELSITFNEDIQTGRLTKNNFSISGVLNAQEIAEPNVGLSFAGARAAYTELPLYTNGNFSFSTWFQRSTANPAGTLLAYGENGNFLTLGFNEAGQAIVKIGGQEYISNADKTIPNDETWKYLSLSYDRDSSILRLYVKHGSTDLTMFARETLAAQPATQGKLYIGNAKDSVAGGFHGAVAYLHAWSNLREQAHLDGDKKYTKAGNEPNLTGYWELNEGEGATAKDKARSRHLVVNDAAWYIYPSGKGLQLNDGENTYAAVYSGNFPFVSYSDFTVEFWFKGGAQASYPATLFSNSNANLTFNASGQLQLNIVDSYIDEYGNGQSNTVDSVKIPASDLLNNSWRHFALSAKGNGSATVYIDGTASASISRSRLGNFSGSFYTFGAKRAGVATISQSFSGNVDDIRVWDAALTADGIRLNKNSKLNGNERGLKAYYPLESYKKNTDGSVSVIATPADLVTLGETNALSIGGANQSAVTIGNDAAGLKDVRPVTDVIFDFVASNNKIVLTPTIDNVNQPLSRLEGVILNISAEKIYDLHGNQSSTIAWTAFVNRNNLKWETEQINITAESGTQQSFTAKIANTGGTNADYFIEDLPSWLSVNATQGTLSPLATKELHFTVYNGLNIGAYDAAIALTGVNGVKEILPVTVKVTANKPGWTVNPHDFESTMNITGQIQIESVYQEDPDDILAAFIGDLCVGITSPVYVKEYNAYFTFMDVYGNSAHAGQNLKFKLWDASTGLVYSKIEFGVPNQPVAFVANATHGDVNTPVIHNALNIIEQSIALENGWNWISVNVTNTNPAILQQFKDKIGSAGELLKGQNGYIQNPGWAGTLASVEKEQAYLVKTNAAATLYFDGTPAGPANTPIGLINGWNWIGYIPQFTLPVNSALAGLHAEVGDQIKGHSGYRTYMGVNGWVGSLDYMRAGLGYMYYSVAAAAKNFVYPSAASQHYNAPALRSASNTTEQRWSVDVHRFSNTMTVTSVAILDGMELQSDEIEIAAFAGEDCRGSILLQDVKSLDRHLGFLMVFGEGNETLRFRIYDHATNTEYEAYPNISFTPDAIYGNPAEPFEISNQPTGLKDITARQITVYPNPVSNWLQINHSLTSIDMLQVIDITGRIVLEKTDFVEKSLNVSSLANGVYLLKLIKDGETVIIKVTKK